MVKVPRPNSRCTIIAEIGINHNGSMDIAKQLIKMAKDADCDFVKFQKRDIDVVYTKELLDQKRESPWGTTQREQKLGLEFSREQYKEIDRYCKEIGMGWFASAWDLNSQTFLREFDCPHNKIASAMLTHWKFVEEVAAEGKHTFISTGMATYQDVDKVVEIFRKKNCPFTLLHCVSTYPCPDDKTNVAVMLSLRERYKCPVGYSGHEVGVAPTMLAAALGADAIERHITVSRAMYGSDQAASLEAPGLKIITKFIRGAQAAYGNGEKTIDETEVPIMKKLRYFEANA
jgi:N-acetylneuraminate synthase